MWNTNSFRRDCDIRIGDLWLRIDIIATNIAGGHRTQIRRLMTNPIITDPENLWDILDQEVYTDWVTQTEYTYQLLGIVASSDFENLLYSQDWFGVAITEAGDDDGYPQGLSYDTVRPPELVVVWECRDGTPVETTTWGAIKALYR